MTASGTARIALQELGGLIQALGVLSGVPIGSGSGSGGGGPSGPPTATATAWGGGQQQHPGTSVHPCGFPGCGKTFARLYSLRAHNTRLHASERPYRCARCPAAFARNHDLKRHERLHEDRAWQCTGCSKAFSRRDALTRHRNAAAGRHGGACATADIAEIDVQRTVATGGGGGSGGGGGAPGGEDEMTLRRSRVWHDTSGAGADSSQGTGITLEEGELPVPILAAAHEAVARLHPILRSCVSRALGGDGAVPAAAAPPLADVDIAAATAESQAMTLASALAQAQAQAFNPIGQSSSVPPAVSSSSSSSSLYGLSHEQAQMLERAIASAASAAQLQAEAEAAQEEEEEDEEEEEEEEEEVSSEAEGEEER